MAGKLITIWLAAAMLWGCTIANSLNSTQLENEWEAACYWTEKLGYEDPCEDLVAPTVVYSDKLLLEILGPGGLGFYIPGEYAVYVSKTVAALYGEEPSTVVVHEMVHYILDHKYGRYVIGRCESEEAARMVGDLYSGRSHTTTWKDRYDCNA